ncbi:MAG: hypothetical protein CL526_08765 [Aequorivita sp.]|nr:hypothetical protein [Aequorivita sp.]|tara:strand:- start:63533 stop:63898 length:366 start_codon:yes stop_codon:yes gene_type:complete
MKKLFTIIVLFIGVTTYSQDPLLQNSNAKVEMEAKELTNQYTAKLSLTGEQQLLFEQKVAEFLISRNKIEAKYSGKEKLNKLYKLQKEETAEMNDILTRPQLEVYKRVKLKFQPLDEVKTE